MADTQSRTLTLLAESVEKLIERIELLDVARTTEVDKNRSTSSIHIDAGGASAWLSSRVAVLCSAFMAGISIGIVAMFVIAANERAELRNADSDFRDYISATYQVAPEFQKRIDAIKATKAAAESTTEK